MTNPARPDGPAADPRHLLVIGAGSGLAGALAHRFAQGGYHLTLLARHTDGLAKLASGLADAGAAAGTVAADASDPGDLRATLTSLYAGTGAPGVLACNASMLTPRSLLSSDVARLHQAYDVDVAGAIVATPVLAHSTS
jgi:short-subunit dehydrogenase